MEWLIKLYFNSKFSTLNPLFPYVSDLLIDGYYEAKKKTMMKNNGNQQGENNHPEIQKLDILKKMDKDIIANRYKAIAKLLTEINEKKNCRLICESGKHFCNAESCNDWWGNWESKDSGRGKNEFWKAKWGSWGSANINAEESQTLVEKVEV